MEWVTLKSVSDTQKTVMITRSPAVLITTCERAASATPAMFFINLVIQSSRSGRPPIADCTWHQMRSGFSSASNEIKMSPSQGLRYCTNTNTSSSLGSQQYQNNGYSSYCVESVWRICRSVIISAHISNCMAFREGVQNPSHM